MNYYNVVIIPAYNPSFSLVNYIKKMIACGFARILVIDDGSRADCRHIFEALETLEEVEVYRHAVNMGKGRSLKDGFAYALDRWGEDERFHGFITADSDGQHSVEDIVKLQEKLERGQNLGLLLGTRDFSLENVPFKSRFGNRVTSIIFYFLYGKKIRDTQTGMRGIPRERAREYAGLSGERFEYEMNMLIHVVRQGYKIEEVPIKTIYIGENKETHFRPVIDSFKIYTIIFRKFFIYLFSSLSASCLDLGMFQIFILMFSGIFSDSMQIIVSTLMARILSSAYNFFINRSRVFKSNGNLKKQIARYYGLCVVQMCLSAFLVAGSHMVFGKTKVLEKAVVDVALFFVSYRIQQQWVFGENK